MDWSYYKSLLNQKVIEAEHNFAYADKKAREAKAVLDSVLREREVFDAAIIEIMEDGKNGQN